LRVTRGGIVAKEQFISFAGTYSGSEMMDELKRSLAKLHGSCVNVQPDGTDLKPECGSVRLEFSGGEWLRATYWRVLGESMPRLSNFDHLQRYGLPRPIDAVRDLRELLRDRRIAQASLEERTGDVIFEFEGDVSLQILNFSGNEVWEFRFMDGGGEWSNYV
jgi:hypothetical protein